MKKQLLFNFRMAAFAALTFLAAQSSFAQSPYTWVGGTSADFLTNTNWTSTDLSMPSFVAADGYIIGASTNNPVLNSGSVTTLSCSTINLNATGANLTTNIPVTATGNISLSLTGASLTTNNTVSTAGLLSMVSGSTVTTNADFTSTSLSNSVINGTLNINSGTFTARHYVGTAGSGAAKIYIATGATLIGSGVSHIGQNLSANHEVNVNGGTYSIPSGASLNVGSTSNRRGYINLNSGLVQVSGTLSLTASSSSTAGVSNAFIVVTGGSFEYNPANLNVNLGTININGGTFKLLNTTGTTTINTSSTSVGTATTGVINIGGGSLIASGPLTIGSATAGLVTVNVNSGTMNIAGALTISAPSGAYTGLINVDAGSIVLDGDQTAGIATLVTAGKIAVSGAALTAGKTISNPYDAGTGKTTVVAIAPLGVNDAKLDANTVAVYAQNQSVKIQAANVLLSEVKVYDVQGRLVASQKSIGSNETSITLNASNQVYVVKVTTADGQVVTKKIVL